MKKGYLAASAALFTISLACIIGTVVQAIRGVYAMASVELWGAFAFHAVTAGLAALLLDKAQPNKTAAGKEGQ